MDEWCFVSGSENVESGLEAKGNNASGQNWNLLNFFGCNRITSTTENSNSFNSTIECGTDALSGKVGTTVSEFTGSSRYRNQADVNHPLKDDYSLTGRHGRDIKTLEDSLQYFKLYDRLQLLEESLERVRRHQNSQEAMEVYNSIMKRLDKDILKLSQEHHPDKVQSRMGTEEELAQAQKLQTALNATRKALNILNKIFLEDIDIDHRYGFYTELDISSLGNEDDIEGHVYEVLFKISLMSDIKQRHIVSEIRKFLNESRSCIDCYIEDNEQDFNKYLGLAIFHLKECIRGYNKLLRELKEVEEECRVERLDNIYSLIRSMRKSCSQQLSHLEELLTVTHLCFEGSFEIFTRPEEFDDYFVCPFVSYVNIMLMCDAFMKRKHKNKLKKLKKKLKNKDDPIFNEQTIGLKSLYYLTSYYDGSKCYETSVQALLEPITMDRNSVKEAFLDKLLKKRDKLKDQFDIEDYNANGTQRHIAEELKKCKEMKSEFEQKKREVVKGIADVKKNIAEMNLQMDKITSDQEEHRKQYEACLAKNAELLMRYENAKRDERGMSQQSGTLDGSEEEFFNKYEARLTNNSELQARFACPSENGEVWDQQFDKIMSDHEELHKQYETCSAENIEHHATFVSSSGTTEMKDQPLDKMMSEREDRRKVYESYLEKNAALIAKIAGNGKN